MKQKLNEEVKTYSYAFAQWVASTDNIEPLVGLIGHDTETRAAGGRQDHRLSPRQCQ